MLCARRVARAPGFARQIQTVATRKSRKYSYQTLSLAVACTVAGAAATHFHLQNSVIHNDTLPKDLPMSGEVNLKTSQKDRGKELLTSEGWGSNGSKLLVFDGSEDSLKSPSPLSWLDGVALRDLVLHETHAACVDARGDVHQWGNVSAQGSIATQPVRTLRGKNIKQLAINGDRLVALSQTGHIFVLSATNVQPVASSSGFKLWDAGDKGGAVELTPRHALTRGEKFVSISVGEHHLLALTSTGRTFAHPFFHKANSHGQLGMRHLEFTADGVSHTVDLVPDAAKDPYALSSPRGRAPTPRQTIPNAVELKDLEGCNVLFEIPALNGIRISQIATGSRTSFVRTSDGRVLGWGANEFGQIGLGENVSLSTITVPTEVVLWRDTSRGTRTACIDIQAGGDLSTFTVERKNGSSIDTVDVLVCGNGQWGGLGNSMFSNGQSNPVRAKGVSGLLEYSERTQNMQPIRPRTVSISPTGHVLVTLETLAGSSGMYGGRDLVVWGANYDYQLGIGKRGNTANAVTLHRLDGSRYLLQKVEATVKDLEGKVWKNKAEVEQTAVAGHKTSVVYWRIVL